jgi:GntR family transcriptional regulator, uxu operon transcriptional repressor
MNVVRADARVVPSGRGRELAELILASFERDGLGPGSRLPTERQLAADLGITRTGVRHALAALEADGRISREVGRGTFLRAAPARAPSADGDAPVSRGPLAPTDFAPADVMTIRRLLEPQAMPLVAIWATARDFGEMERCLAGGDAAATFEEFETWDLALHRCIIGAAHSPLLAALYGLVESARHGQVWGDLKRHSTSSQRRELYQEDHRAIVAALRMRDSDAAVEAMRTHLSRVAEHLLGGAR